MGILSEIKKGFKKVTEEVIRPTIFGGTKSGSPLGLIKDIFSGPEIPVPPAPDPIAPSPTQVSGQVSDEIRRRQRSKVSGRRKTIVTGELSPTRVGKKNLLGR
jgi:hypothetical protein